MCFEKNQSYRVLQKLLSVLEKSLGEISYREVIKYWKKK